MQMIHRYRSNISKRTIITLHGTGGDELDLINVALRIDPEANVLGLRGNVVENGMYRFFERFSPGEYNLKSYEEETKKLFLCIKYFSNMYKFDLTKTTIVGFSNGANIALGLVQMYPNVVNDYVLISPDYIDKDKDFQSLKGKNIFISASKEDPYVPYKKIDELLVELENKNATIDLYNSKGHQLDLNILQAVSIWYKKIITP
ncbi:MAG: hypothetical protein RBQ97_03465 [Acholeplasma sp.]|nr:hypothetical protein [Acholeplasma sp.]